MNPEHDCCTTTDADGDPPMLYEDVELKAMEDRIQANLLKRCIEVFIRSEISYFIHHTDYEIRINLHRIIERLISFHNIKITAFWHLDIVIGNCIYAIECPFTSRNEFIDNIKNRTRENLINPYLDDFRLLNVNDLLLTIDIIADDLVFLYDGLYQITLN